MFTDLYLKFADESEMRSVLFEKVPTKFEDSEPDKEPVEVEWEEQQIYRHTDIINLIATKDATIDPESGEIITEAEYAPGFHVNVRAVGEDTSALEDYRVNPEPATPARIWA